LRLKTIDGLRGIAAFAVVLFHLNGAIADTFPDRVHWLVTEFLRHGFLGVDVFFVLSGFVISFSIRNDKPSLPFLGRFALRRSVRLDPPYWLAILAEVFFIWLGLKFALADEPLPSIGRIVSHFFYLQNLLDQGDIIPIFWTLCFEIQFYLTLVGLLVIAGWAERFIGHRGVRLAGFALLGSTFVYSVFLNYGVFGLELHPGWAVRRWFQFFMGTCLWWVVSERVGWQTLVGSWIMLLVVIWIQDVPLVQTLPIWVTALLWWSYRRDRMATIFSGRTIQFLGAISYSLYLYHSTIAQRSIKLIGMLTGPDASIAIIISAFLAALAVSILVSWLGWRWVERPSTRWSKQLRMREQGLAPLESRPAGAA
jgi:peptidoglycan/LPS O-acetylase OafA/YrhL